MDPYDALEQQIVDAPCLQDAVAVLRELLSGGYAPWIGDTLCNILQPVVRGKAMQLNLVTDEVARPCFQLRGADLEAVFLLKEGALVQGNLDRREQGLVRWWYQRALPHLLSAWKTLNLPNDVPRSWRA